MQPNSGTYDIFLFLFLISLAMLAGFGMVTIFISINKKRKKENIVSEANLHGEEPIIPDRNTQQDEDNQ